MKFLIWLVVAWAVVVWMQRSKKNLARRARDAAAQAAAAGADFGAAGARNGGPHSNPFGAGPQPAQAAPAIEQMVQCAQCGIHFPKSEEIQARGTGKVFCCTEHRELYALDAGAGVH